MTDNPALYAARMYFLSRGYVIKDVPYDGNCALWSVKDAFERLCEQIIDIDNLRELIVRAWSTDPSFNDLLETDAAVDGGEIDKEDLLEEFAQQNAFLPPVLVAKAVEYFTNETMRVYGMGVDLIPFELYKSDTDNKKTTEYDNEILYIDTMAHVVRVKKFQFPPLTLLPPVPRFSL